MEHVEQEWHDDQVWPDIAKVLPEEADNQDQGNQRPDQVDEGLTEPPALTFPEPVDNHPGLGKREWYEHPDRIQRDQHVGLSVED